MARVFNRKEAWWIDYFHNGRRYRQKIGAKRKAEDALAAVRSKIAAGEFISPDERRQSAAIDRKPVSFEDFAQDEYLPWSETHHSAQHHRLQQSILRVQLLPHFDGCHLQEITPKMLDDYVSQRKRGSYLKGRTRRPVKAGTVNRDIACLKILFRKAVEWDMLEESPTKGLKSLTELPNAPRLPGGVWAAPGCSLTRTANPTTMCVRRYEAPLTRLVSRTASACTSYATPSAHTRL